MRPASWKLSSGCTDHTTDSAVSAVKASSSPTGHSAVGALARRAEQDGGRRRSAPEPSVSAISTVVMSREVQPAAGDERDEAEHAGDQQRRPPRVARASQRARAALAAAAARGAAAGRASRQRGARRAAAAAAAARGASERGAALSRSGGHGHAFGSPARRAPAAQASRKASSASSGSGSELNAEAMLAWTTPGLDELAADAQRRRAGLRRACSARCCSDGVSGVATAAAAAARARRRRRPRRAARGGSGWRSRSTLRLRSAAPSAPGGSPAG